MQKIYISGSNKNSQPLDPNQIAVVYPVHDDQDIIFDPIDHLQYSEKWPVSDRLRIRFSIITGFDTLYMRDGWTTSKIAMAEYIYAAALGKKFIFETASSDSELMEAFRHNLICE